MRTTAAEVKQIMPDIELTDVLVEAYIKAANTWLNKIMNLSGLGEEILTEIERWVTAHLITVTRERQAKKEGAGGAFIEYAGDFGEGLKSSSFGQTAIMLDTSGRLAAAGKQSIMMKAL